MAVQFPLQGQVCVVTGGSGAIGSAICRHFAEAGAACVVTYNKGERAAKNPLAALPGDGDWSAPVPVDDTPALNALAGKVLGEKAKGHRLGDCPRITPL